MDEKEQKALLDKIKSEVTAEMEKQKGLTKEDVENIVKEAAKANPGLDAEKLKELNEDIADLKKVSEKVNNLGKIQKEENKNYKTIIKSVFDKEGFEANVRKVYEAGSGTYDVSKVVGNVTTANVTTDSGGIALLDYLNADDISGLKLRDTFIEQFATVTRTSKPVYTYAEWIPGEGDADARTEGATKPQVDHDLKVTTETPIKVPAYEVLTEEAISDVDRMESTAREVILKRVLLKRQKVILFGSDAAAGVPAHTGLTEAAPTFSRAAGVDPSLPAAQFNEYVAVAAAILQVKMAQNHVDDIDFMPNVIFLNPVDVYNMKLTREGSDGTYLFPNMTLLQQNQIEGIRVVERKEIPAGSVLVGDFTRLNIVNYIDFAIKMGWINAQFIENQFTMLGESRFYSFVKTQDQKAFVYDTFANISTALQAI